MFYFFSIAKKSNTFVYLCYGKQRFYVKSWAGPKLTNKQKPSKIMRQAINEWQLPKL